VWICTAPFGKLPTPICWRSTDFRSSSKDNPKEQTIHFSGIKGQATRQRYMDITHDTMDKDGHVKTLPLFTDIDVRIPKYTFSHPNGLLFATQLARIDLAVTEKAAICA
jgi:fatty acid synthase subunit alpha, fungi type